MLPSVSQNSTVQVSGSSPALNSQQSASGALTSDDALEAVREKPERAVPDVKVEIRSEAAVASAAQVVSAAEPASESTELPSSTRSNPQQAVGSTGSQSSEAPDQAPVSVAEQKLAQSYSESGADPAGAKGSALDLVV